MSKDFCHLHVHHQYSLLDGLGSAEQYVERANDLGMEYLAITDHGNVDGCLKFQKACQAGDIKPVFGSELYVVKDASVKEKGEKRLHVTVLVAHPKGWQNLLQLTTKANLDGFYRRPRVDPDMIFEHCDGLFWMTACTSTILKEKWGLEFMKNLVQEVGDDRVLGEIMPHDFEDQLVVNEMTLDFADEFGGRIGVVATNDCHYPLEKDAELQEVLLAIQRQAKWKDPNRWRFSVTGLHLRSREEMMDAFIEQGGSKELIASVDEALDLTVEIAEECYEGFPELPGREVSLPRVQGVKSDDDTEAMWSVIEDGWEELIEGKTPKLDYKDREVTEKMYDDRIEEEMEIICNLGFQRYFLIVWELINWCRHNDVMTGPGRGSVGGSLVAYLMRITGVDPLVHGLVFSRFISPARIDLPDIDMDFEDRKRHLVRKHLEDMYGKDCVAGVSTFSTLKGKAAIRDIGRVFDLPYIDIDKAAKAIVVRSMGDDRADYTIEDAFETFEDGKRFKKKYPHVADFAMRIEGQVRGAGQHAAGICVSEESLLEGRRCSLAVRGKDVVVANWDKHDVEYFGMMKLDVLGLSALSVLSDAKDMIKKNHGVDVDYESLTLDDPDVLAEVSMGHTVGAFQLSSPGLRRFCEALGIQKFSDIVDATALWRPGTLRAGTAEEFRARKNGESEWEHIHPSMKDLTEDTHGIILYQEQIMMLAYDLAGMTWKNCDLIRKVVSKSQGDSLFAKYKTMFVEGCSKKGTLDPSAAGEVWDELSSFGSYGFNKSHSVEYSMITYWDMWLKVYYPAEFMAATLTHAKDDLKDELIKEARRLKLKIVPPKVKTSEPESWVAKGTDLLMPLLEIKGIGPKACEKIRKLREGVAQEGFFAEKEVDKNLPSNIVKVLQRVHAFDDEKLSFTDDEVEEIADLLAFDMSQDPLRDIRGILNLLDPYLYSIDDILTGGYVDKTALMFGKIDEMKYSYKKGVQSHSARRAGSSSLGGVYGYIRDDSAAEMITFDGDLYKQRKDEIEHCKGKNVVIESTRGKGINVGGKQRIKNVFCQKIWFDDQLKSADIFDMDVDLIGVSKQAADPECLVSLDNCESCELSKICRGPVPADPGLWNVMAVGEAPGKDEDAEGTPFIGASGKLAWQILGKQGITRDLIHVTNVAKCFPGKGKAPTTKQMRTCSERWLDKEVEEIKPVVILVLGNTPLQWISGQKSGIMSLNATTEWSPIHNAWICYCVHPASALHSAENRRPLISGLKNFARTLEAVGADLGTPRSRVEGKADKKERGEAGRQRGLEIRNRILKSVERKGGTSTKEKFARIRNAMKDLFFRTGEPVSVLEARSWCEANDVELEDPQWGAIFNTRKWQFVRTIHSDRPEAHGKRICLFEYVG